MNFESMALHTDLGKALGQYQQGFVPHLTPSSSLKAMTSTGLATSRIIWLRFKWSAMEIVVVFSSSLSFNSPAFTAACKGREIVF